MVPAINLSCNPVTTKETKNVNPGIFFFYKYICVS